MRHTKKSLITFALLFGLVVFFSGLHLGKSIERLDKTYVPPTPVVPSPTMNPSPSGGPKTISYKVFKFAGCGVSFVVPSDLNPRTTPPDEAEFTNGSNRIFVSCNDSFVVDQEKLFTTASASSSATLNNQTVTTYTVKQDSLWTVRNTNRQKVLFSTSRSLAPLIQQTLELR